MGFLDDSEDDNGSSKQLQDQIAQNDREIQGKLANLRKQRIALVKGMGAPDFTGSNKNAPIMGKSPGM